MLVENCAMDVEEGYCGELELISQELLFTTSTHKITIVIIVTITGELIIIVL